MLDLSSKAEHTCDACEGLLAREGMEKARKKMIKKIKWRACIKFPCQVLPRVSGKTQSR